MLFAWYKTLKAYRNRQKFKRCDISGKQTVYSGWKEQVKQAAQ